MKKIGLLGCGAIGTQIALAIDSGKIPAKLTHVYDGSKEASAKLVEKLNSKPIIVENSHLLSSNPVDIIVEAASQDAVKDVSLSVLQNKKDLMIMSVGALLDESIYDILSDACKDFKKTIYLPSGAIAGLDGIKAVHDELDSLSITTTKHPRSLKGAKFFENSDIDLDSLDSKTEIFQGTAKQAVSLFPANINVAALLSLTGIGSENTKVVIVADPKTDKNTHHIEAKGSFGKMTFTIENFPDPNNPKTSRLAILSAIETLRKYCSDEIQIGT
ncbi:MAG: aspartate dehydrogenase [Nitrososphaeria archaeon]|nr:aspartate dehydrogenase [Nitrosopumilaceae archaeon]NIP09033.1 aspartate dehydrogenase [Nitrosopumilaceae archaeon]NIP91402.1 aspartate dehydrogenase [Nitrososphaeria archaeon]NIS95229.1 aspartate dehydrogenase [Nitrosopumilaceae archaeon]